MELRREIISTAVEQPLFSLLLIIDQTLMLTSTFRHSTMSSLRKNLTPKYPFDGPSRQIVPQEYWNWDIGYHQYNPPKFTIPGILKGDKPWADPEIGSPNFNPKFNAKDGRLNRTSWMGTYRVDESGFPLNPIGRTGMGGRGSLGRWGPNHASDCIVTRYKTGDHGEILLVDNKPVLEFVAIKRGDTGELAIPGGMVDPGESSIMAARREFVEEVIGVDESKGDLKFELQTLFDEATIVEKTYVDDHRSTDNAWIETVAVNFHIKPSYKLPVFENMKFKSGSDAASAFWADCDCGSLYASHNLLIKKAVTMLQEEFARKQLNYYQ